MNNLEHNVTTPEKKVKWYHGISVPLTILQLTYFYASSKFLADNLENSRALQATFPLYIAGTVTGSFLLREAYVRTIRKVKNILNFEN